MQALFHVMLLSFSHHTSTMADLCKTSIEEPKGQYDEEERAAATALCHDLYFSPLYSLYYPAILAIFPITLAPFLSVLPHLAIVPAF
jgi:hypothetical protein